MTADSNLKSLPLLVQPLDIQHKTKPVAVVVCPRRGDVRCVDVCSQCPGLRRIDLGPNGAAILRCESDARRWDTSTTLGGDIPRVRELVRLPTLCVAEDTPLAALAPMLTLVDGADSIPVLDEHANPVGVVKAEELSRLIQEGIDLDLLVSTIMRARLPVVYTHTKQVDAMRRAVGAEADTLFVVGFEGTLLGVVDRKDLEAAQTQA